ncbi:hypothetical protein [Novosphingobium panipatense]|uniref:Uncharacterized protein n=1 Tax=Novosphingobium panipatense TaxID=428991 RepID=A0ABY1Q4U2_9SPHN|nr:hypothetical protein [Novosphingobium panipatense]SMP58462.1 hypothetical protein SAMN06296065_102476 [Novosphingobium panipatense]
MTYPTITPAQVHQSHHVLDEGTLITDPICQHCRRDATYHGEALRAPCPGSRKEPEAPQRLTDQELRQLLMLAHGHIHQYVPLRHSKAHDTRKLQERLRAAWEGLEPSV